MKKETKTDKLSVKSLTPKISKRDFREYSSSEHKVASRFNKARVERLMADLDPDLIFRPD